MNIYRLFEDIYNASQEKDANTVDPKNKDGRSVDYQHNSKEPEVRAGGCYLYSLVNGAEVNPNETDELYKKFVADGKVEPDCTVKNPEGILSELTGDDYTGTKSSNYDPNADIAIAKWSNNSHEHFVQMDGPEKDDIVFDSLGHSNTCATGDIESWRLFYKKS